MAAAIDPRWAALWAQVDHLVDEPLREEATEVAIEAMAAAGFGPDDDAIQSAFELGYMRAALEARGAL